MPRDYKRALAEAQSSRDGGLSLMGELGAFLKIHRVGFDKRDPSERVADYKQYFALPRMRMSCRRQGARCMDCGVAFCHEGCPLWEPDPGLERPRLPRQVARGDRSARIRPTTSRIHQAGSARRRASRPASWRSTTRPSTIEQIEMAIAERAFEEGWVVPEPPARRTGKTVAVIGSGPAGLAVAALS